MKNKNLRGRVVSVPESVAYRALAAIAAVLEEPYCVCGSDELHGLVLAYRGLSVALGDAEPDYAFVAGAVVVRGVVIKRGVEGAPDVAPGDGPRSCATPGSYFGLDVRASHGPSSAASA